MNTKVMLYEKRSVKVLDSAMAYVEIGQGDAIVFSMATPHRHICGAIFFRSFSPKPDVSLRI